MPLQKLKGDYPWNDGLWLVLDESEAVRKQATAQLQGFGFNVVSGPTAKGLELYKKERPKVIILNVNDFDTGEEANNFCKEVRTLSGTSKEDYVYILAHCPVWMPVGGQIDAMFLGLKVFDHQEDLGWRLEHKGLLEEVAVAH